MEQVYTKIRAMLRCIVGSSLFAKGQYYSIGPAVRNACFPKDGNDNDWSTLTPKMIEDMHPRFQSDWTLEEFYKQAQLAYWTMKSWEGYGAKRAGGETFLISIRMRLIRAISAAGWKRPSAEVFDGIAKISTGTLTLQQIKLWSRGIVRRWLTAAAALKLAIIDKGPPQALAEPKEKSTASQRRALYQEVLAFLTDKNGGRVTKAWKTAFLKRTGYILTNYEHTASKVRADKNKNFGKGLSRNRRTEAEIKDGDKEIASFMEGRGWRDFQRPDDQKVRAKWLEKNLPGMTVEHFARRVLTLRRAKDAEKE